MSTRPESRPAADPALEWIHAWILELLAALVTGHFADARHATWPGTTDEGLKPFRVDGVVKRRTATLCAEAHAHLSLQPVDAEGARTAILRIATLWGVEDGKL